MCDGVYQLVFLSPEALLSNETWRDTVPSPVYQENLVAVVIDEFYQHSCHVTLGSNVTNYIPLWNENLAHVTRRIFPSLPPPPFPRACAPRGKIRMACETNCDPGRGCFYVSIQSAAVGRSKAFLSFKKATYTLDI